MIYFVQAGDTVKIGYGSDGWERVRQVKTYTPHEVKLLGVKDGSAHDEASLHSRFQQYRLPRRQRDWFQLSDEIKEFIQAECREMVELPKPKKDRHPRRPLVGVKKAAPPKKSHSAEVGERLYEIRRSADIHQGEFSKRTGIQRSMVSLYESGSRMLTLKAALRVCQSFGVTLDYIYLGIGRPA